MAFGGGGVAVILTSGSRTAQSSVAHQPPCWPGRSVLNFDHNVVTKSEALRRRKCGAGNPLGRSYICSKPTTELSSAGAIAVGPAGLKSLDRAMSTSPAPGGVVRFGAFGGQRPFDTSRNVADIGVISLPWSLNRACRRRPMLLNIHSPPQNLPGRRAATATPPQISAIACSCPPTPRQCGGLIASRAS
jgi:hypothetical protein